MPEEWRVDGEDCIRVYVDGREVIVADSSESDERDFGLWEEAVYVCAEFSMIQVLHIHA
ncbi:hypothetical protein [uncultured Brevibacillus sp.]|uniref:hypothetical protein n=1 Tax=uncultured Brevibacillus sp. TaxID=169970 RepID=UPI0025987B1C|nr:hypothetical protein [uncultured Brevibacillus sp.]